MTAKGAKDGFNKFAAGAKRYGGGRSMPSIGKNKKAGYNARDARLAAMQRRAGKGN